MSISGTGCWLPVCAPTPLEKPPFLNYSILTVTADTVEFSFVAFISLMCAASSLPRAW